MLHSYVFQFQVLHHILVSIFQAECVKKDICQLDPLHYRHVVAIRGHRFVLPLTHFTVCNGSGYVGVAIGVLGFLSLYLFSLRFQYSTIFIYPSSIQTSWLCLWVSLRLNFCCGCLNFAAIAQGQWMDWIINSYLDSSVI